LKRIIKVTIAFVGLWNLIFCISHSSIKHAYILSNTEGVYILINFPVFSFLSFLLHVFNILFYSVSSPDSLRQDCCSNLTVNIGKSQMLVVTLQL